MHPDLQVLTFNLNVKNKIILNYFMYQKLMLAIANIRIDYTFPINNDTLALVVIILLVYQAEEEEGKG